VVWTSGSRSDVPRRSPSWSRRVLVASAGALLAGPLLSGPLLGGPAAAAPSSVSIPRHDAPTQALSLVGASEQALAVQYDDQFDGAYPSVAGGPAGSGGQTGNGSPVSELTPRAVLGRHVEYTYTQRLGVRGEDLFWWGEIPRTSTTPDRYVLHRTDLLTGQDDADEVPRPPVALAGDGWLSWSGNDLLRTSFDAAGTDAPTTVVSGVHDGLRVVADDDGALLVSMSPDAGPRLRRYRLDLITFGSGTAPATVERVADSLDFIGTVALSDDTVAWLSCDQQVAHPVSINVRARAGGALRSAVEKNVYLGDELPLAAAHGRVAYVVPDPSGTVVRVVTGGSDPATIALPAGATAGAALEVPVAAVGDRFLTAVSGPSAAAGVYAIDPVAGTEVRVAVVRSPPIGVVALAFTNSRVYYADPSGAGAGLGVFSRTVSGEGTPVLSPESELGPRASRLRDIPGRSISFSAGRASLENPDDARYEWRFLDRGRVTGAAVQPRPDESDSGGLVDEIHPVTSGPYTLVRGKVYDPAGRLRFTRPGAGSIQTARDDIYGTDLIYSLAEYRAGSRSWVDTVWLRDFSKRRSATNPRRLARHACGSGCPRPVAIWGDVAAWASDGGHLVVLDLRSGRTRTVATGGTLQELVLGEGTLGWQAPGPTTHLLDLTSPTSVPVTLAGKATLLTLDDHRFARRATLDGRIVIDRLPFGGPHRPRLLGTFAPSSFTPSGGRTGSSGQAGLWRPQFDVTKPLSRVALRIRGPRSGRTFRTLTGTAPDGSVRDLAWDGRTGAGTRLPAGTYRWQLSAEAQDGEGALIAERGGPVTGTVTLKG
jgi:FlgD Ig-like domain